MFARTLGLLSVSFALAASAQERQKAEPFNLVMPNGSGRIVLPSGQNMVLEQIAVYDGGQRPVAHFEDKTAGVSVSYILFHNLSGDPTGKGCREDVLGPLVRRFGSSISNLKRSADSSPGESLVTASYFIESMDGHPVRQQNLFGFLGDAKTCVEIHLSKTGYKPAEEALLTSQLATLRADLGYSPTAKDYFLLATVLFKSAPASAVPYYKESLALLPAGPEDQRPRRVVTDQLAMSLGISGNIQESRSVLQDAIRRDPDYPLNYYNLACADAEQGDAVNAKAHLQQAFDRKGNTLKGETLPDPTKDDSLQKLQKNKTFWDYAKSLSAESSGTH